MRKWLALFSLPCALSAFYFILKGQMMLASVLLWACLFICGYAVGFGHVDDRWRAWTHRRNFVAVFILGGLAIIVFIEWITRS